MQTEGLEREGLAVEEYRATTQLLRTADALRAMVRSEAAPGAFHIISF